MAAALALVAHSDPELAVVDGYVTCPRGSSVVSSLST
jgi:hypothetical protein